MCISLWRYRRFIAFTLGAILFLVLIGCSIFLGSITLLIFTFVSSICMLQVYQFGGKCHGWLGLIRDYVTGSTHDVVPQLLALLERNRALSEIASALFRFFRRLVTHVESTRDNITAGQPENVRSAPECDAAIAHALSISNEDGSRSQTIRRFIDSEHTRPLNPPYPMVAGPRPAWNEQHRNPSKLNFQSTIPRVPAPASEEVNRNLSLNESESSSSDGESTSTISSPGPSGLQWRRGVESDESDVDTHSQSIFRESRIEVRIPPIDLYNPTTISERIPTIRQPVIGLNRPGQVAQTEESPAVSLRIYRTISFLHETFQSEQNDQTFEESSI